MNNKKNACKPKSVRTLAKVGSKAPLVSVLSAMAMMLRHRGALKPATSVAKPATRAAHTATRLLSGNSSLVTGRSFHHRVSVAARRAYSGGAHAGPKIGVAQSFFTAMDPVTMMGSAALLIAAGAYRVFLTTAFAFTSPCFMAYLYE